MKMPSAIICCWEYRIKGWFLVEAYWELISGRATTIWSLDHGVSLLDFNPPNYPEWLGVGFIDSLKKNKEWYSFIQDGYRMFKERL